MNILKKIRLKFFGGEPKIEKTGIKRERASTRPARNERRKRGKNLSKPQIKRRGTRGK